MKLLLSFKWMTQTLNLSEKSLIAIYTQKSSWVERWYNQKFIKNLKIKYFDLLQGTLRLTSRSLCLNTQSLILIVQEISLISLLKIDKIWLLMFQCWLLKLFQSHSQVEIRKFILKLFRNSLRNWSRLLISVRETAYLETSNQHKHCSPFKETRV